MELGESSCAAFQDASSRDDAAAQHTLVLHLLIDYISHSFSHFTFLVFLQESKSLVQLAVFLAKMVAIEPSAYMWLPGQNHTRNNTNVWFHTVKLYYWVIAWRLWPIPRRLPGGAQGRPLHGAVELEGDAPLCDMDTHSGGINRPRAPGDGCQDPGYWPAQLGLGIGSSL